MVENVETDLNWVEQIRNIPFFLGRESQNIPNFGRKSKYTKIWSRKSKHIKFRSRKSKHTKIWSRRSKHTVFGRESQKITRAFRTGIILKIKIFTQIDGGQIKGSRNILGFALIRATSSLVSL